MRGRDFVEDKTSMADSSCSYLLSLSAIFLACCATAVDKCNEGQVLLPLHDIHIIFTISQ